MNRLGFLCCICLLFPFLLKAQQTTSDYQVLKSSGKIPEKFITTSAHEYFEEVGRNVSENDARRVKKRKNEFLLENSFIINELLLSGKVLFNDPVGSYLNKVMDQLLKDDKKLRSQIEVYAIKSPYVNAFTTNNGMIFVNIGLVARLDNEAQLAFVLSHEITHYRKKHVINSYLQVDSISNGKGMYRRTSVDDRLLAVSQYSKEKEWEADREGLELYVKSGYDLSSLGHVFDILAYAGSTVYNIPFDPSFLETADYKFPKKLLVDSVSPVLPDTADEKYGSHPGVGMRKADILKRISGLPNDGRKTFIVSQDEFNQVKKTCLYEVCSLYLADNAYRTCIYHAYALMQHDAGSKYLKSCIFKSLYCLSKIKNYPGDDSQVDTSHALEKGYIYHVKYLLDGMEDYELNVVALAYGWKLEKQYPADSNIKGLVADLSSDLVQRHNKALVGVSPKLGSIYRAEFKDTVVAGPDGVEKHDRASETAVQKVDVFAHTKTPVSQVNQVLDDSSFVKDGLSTLTADKNFTDMFVTAVHDYKLKENKKALWEKDHPKKHMEKEEEDKYVDDYDFNTVEINTGEKMDRIVFLNPFYYKFNNNKRNPVRYVASEDAQHRLNNLMKKNATLAGLNFIMLDKKNLTVQGVDTFNDITALESFLSERTDFEDMPYHAELNDNLESFRSKYKSDYLCTTGIISVREKSHVTAGQIFFSIFYPPSIPFVLFYAFKPHYSTYYYSALYNLRTGGKVHVTLERYKFNDRNDVLNVSMYDLYNRYKKSY